MSFRLLSILGILVAIICFGVFGMLHPGGFDWKGDYLSTLLRGDSSLAWFLAVIGMIIFCTSIAMIFERLARASEW